MGSYGLTHSLEDLHQLLLSLAKNDLVEHANGFFDRVKDRFEVTAKSYCILINGWCEIGDAENAVKLFGEMVERGCVVDVVAYNSLIMALCRAKKLDEAHLRLQEMREVYGLEPDAATYSAFVRAACEENDVHTAGRVMDRMRRYKLVPNVFTFNCVIRLVCKMEKIEEAYQVLDEMVELGVKPDVWSYNSVLAVHCRLHEVNMALRLLPRMDRDGCLPDRHTYNMLLKMLIDVGRIDRAMEVWDGMEGRGFHPGVSSYAVMIHGLCMKKDKVKEAYRFFTMMVDEGIPPYLNTCEVLRDKLLQNGYRDHVQWLLGKMQRSTSCTIKELSTVMERRKKIDASNI